MQNDDEVAELVRGSSLGMVVDIVQTNTSQMSVLVNEEKFCFQSSGGRGGSICNDDGYGHFNTTGPINENIDWAPVNIKPGMLVIQTRAVTNAPTCACCESDLMALCMLPWIRHRAEYD